MKTNSLRDKRTGGEKGEWLGAVGVLEWNCAVQSVRLRWCVCVRVCARVCTHGRLCCAEAVGLAWAVVGGEWVCTQWAVLVCGWRRAWKCVELVVCGACTPTG